MPLTRNDYIDMWSSVKAIEYDLIQVRATSRQLGPHVRGQFHVLTLGMDNELKKLKTYLQAVLGQME